MISGSDAASIFMEPIHLSSAIAAKKIISEGETGDDSPSGQLGRLDDVHQRFQGFYKTSAAT